MKKKFICLIILLLCVPLAGACGQAEKSNGVKNPVVTYETLRAAEAAVGFDLPLLPGDFDVQSYSVIDGTIIQVVCGRHDQDVEATFRMAEGRDDISGIYGIEYESQQINGLPVNLGTYDDIRVASFHDDSHAYSLTAIGIDGSEFRTLVGDWTAAIVNGITTEE